MQYAAEKAKPFMFGRLQVVQTERRNIFSINITNMVRVCRFFLKNIPLDRYGCILSVLILMEVL